jgi:hypothetical protein
VVPVSTATDTAGQLIDLLGAMVPAPDGKTVYVVTGGGVVPVSTATNIPGPLMIARTGQGGVDDAVITPDGKTVYAATRAGLIPVSTATGKPGRLIRLGFSPSLLTITP